MFDKQRLTMGEFIIANQNSFQYTSGELSRLLNGIRLAAKVVNHEVNKAGLVDITGAAGDTNIQGEDQQKLDVLANEKFIETLKNREIVCGIASEEEDDFITINSFDKQHQNKYVVLIDPLDGSSNIDVNVSVGTIFSIYRRITPVGTPVTLEDFHHRTWCKWFYVKSCTGHFLLIPPQYAIPGNGSNLLCERG